MQNIHTIFIGLVGMFLMYTKNVFGVIYAVCKLCRYLFEAIEFFGQEFNEDFDYTLLQSSGSLLQFNSFADLINFPRWTTESMHDALNNVGDNGCVLQLIPKYNGILNTAKWINLRELSEDYNDEQRSVV